MKMSLPNNYITHPITNSEHIKQEILSVFIKSYCFYLFKPFAEKKGLWFNPLAGFVLLQNNHLQVKKKKKKKFKKLQTEMLSTNKQLKTLKHWLEIKTNKASSYQIG